MNSPQALNTLRRAGLAVSLTAERAIKIAPASAITPELRALIQAAKTELVEYLAATPANDAHPARIEPLNMVELEMLAARLTQFTDRGLIVSFAETLADRLTVRDRERDDRRLCLECRHLVGTAGNWRCGNWQRAGVALRASDAGLGEQAKMLQRCIGFG